MIIESSASTVVNICRSVFESCVEGSHTAYTVDLSWIHKKCKRPRAVTFLGRGATDWNIWVCSGCHQGSTWNHNSLGLCGGMIKVAYISSWFPLFQTIAIHFSCFRISSENDLLYLSLIPVLIHCDIFLKWKDKICSAHDIPNRNSMLTFQEMDQTLKVTVRNAVIPQRGNVLSLGYQGDVSWGQILLINCHWMLFSQPVHLFLLRDPFSEEIFPSFRSLLSSMFGIENK